MGGFGRSAKIIMSKKKIDLKASTLGEKWFERAVNHAVGIWFSVCAILLGMSFTLIYNVYPSRDPGLMVHFGPLWLMLALVHFERYHARKAFERLMNNGDIASRDSQLNEKQEAEQGSAHQSTTAS